MPSAAAALRTLTGRGWGFLAAAAAIAVSAPLTGEKDLLAAAVLLCTIPLLSVGLVSLARFRLATARQLQPDRVRAGEEAKVTIWLENTTPVATGTLLIDDQLPYALASPQRHRVDRLGGGDTVKSSYVICPSRRGHYPIGPLTVQFTDPFGLATLTRAFASHSELIVTPAVIPLPSADHHLQLGGVGERRARSAALVGMLEPATRAYQDGDDVRKIHWRASARLDELQVRREEKPQHSTATVFLDTRSIAHRGADDASSFEWAVAAAASICAQLEQVGYDVTLLTAGGRQIRGSTDAILQALASVDLTPDSTLDPAASPPAARGQHAGLTVALVGVTDDVSVTADIAALLPLRAPGSAGFALLIGSRRAASLLDTADATFAAAQWRVGQAVSGTNLTALWGELVGATPYREPT